MNAGSPYPTLGEGLWLVAQYLWLIGWATFIAGWAFRKWLAGLDPAASFGISGLVGLGTLGTLILLVGSIPSSLSLLASGLVPAVGVAGILLFVLGRWRLPGLRFGLPRGLEWLVLVVGLAAIGMAAVVVLAPSTSSDWDSIAYHMALPKLYLQAGSIERIRFISHSNFPEAVELLFLPSVAAHSQAGCKVILLGFSVLGCLAIFGLAREAYGRAAGWWAVLAFATVPTVLWESATAYIDVAHGLFAGLGVILALRSSLGRGNYWGLAGVLLGLACGTKYTGLQVVLVLGIICGYLAWRKISAEGYKPILLMLSLSAVIGGPWYAKNIMTTGSPTYPFLFEQFGGRDWDQKRADIYRDEQLSFGVGVDAHHKSWTEIGHAIFGLAYQPGRYVNPLQTVGGGSPLGAVGVAIFGGFLFYAFARKPDQLEASLLAFAGISLVLWFALSQQSRYIVTLAVPGALMVGGACVQAGLGRLVAAATSLQALYTIGLYKTAVFDDALFAVGGSVSTSDYLHARLPFTEATEAMNQLPKGSKVALYDQVFGYYLDIPYFWANPPHCTVIPYDSMSNGSEYVSTMRRLGFTHIYIQFVDRENDGSFRQALGEGGAAVLLPDLLRKKWRGDWIQVWKVYLSEAVQAGEVVPVQGFKGGLLLTIQPERGSQR